jgi:shikimate kinase
MNIALMGYRGSGKTTFGQYLAKTLGWEFVDTDQRICALAGESIAAIFAQHGEAGFRQAESDVVKSLEGHTRTVIALGGGAVLRRENVASLKQHAHLVWLDAPAEVLYTRIQADPTSQANRPNLTTQGGLEEVRRLLQQRNGIYAACADLRVDTTQPDAAGLLAAVYGRWPELQR